MAITTGCSGYFLACSKPSFLARSCAFAKHGVFHSTQLHTERAAGSSGNKKNVLFQPSLFAAFVTFSEIILGEGFLITFGIDAEGMRCGWMIG